MNNAEEALRAKLHSSFFHIASLNPEDLLPETLYHYTSAVGLHGILSSGVLRGTNYGYLNDSSEIRHGLDEILIPELRDRIGAESQPAARSLLQATSEKLRSTTKNLDYYLTCFCQTDDLLSQWRGYGDDRGRFCIGFDADPLQLIDANLMTTQGSVIYDKPRQRAKVKDALDRAIGTVLERQSPGEPFRAAIADLLVRKLLETNCFFKHAGFTEEKEWRYVCFAPDMALICIEPMNGLLKPFVKMISTPHNSQLPISEVLVGPSRLDGLAMKSADLLLQKFGYTEVRLHATSVPFREL